MNKSLSLLLSDLASALQSTNVEDMTMPLGFLLWTIILLFPLRRIDRRDISSAATYILFCMAAGVVLIFAIPRNFVDPPPLKTQVIATMGMALLAGMRWTLKWERIFAKERRTQRSFAEEDEEFGRRNASDSAGNAGRAKNAA